MKEDRLCDILETMKKNQLKGVLSHFGALSDHSALAAQYAPQHVTRYSVRKSFRLSRDHRCHVRKYLCKVPTTHSIEINL